MSSSSEQSFDSSSISSDNSAHTKALPALVAVEGVKASADELLAELALEAGMDIATYIRTTDVEMQLHSVAEEHRASSA